MEMLSSIPALPVRGMAAAVDFYGTSLGFTPLHQDEDFAVVRRDAVIIHLWKADDVRWRERVDLAERPVESGAESFIAGTASCRIEVRGIDELHAELKAADVLYAPDTPIVSTAWGTREFPTLDLERNLLTFFERA